MRNKERDKKLNIAILGHKRIPSREGGVPCDGSHPGFIGANLSMRLLGELSSGRTISFDSMNDYYDVSLKEYRLTGMESDFGFPYPNEIIEVNKRQ